MVFSCRSVSECASGDASPCLQGQVSAGAWQQSRVRLERAAPAAARRRPSCRQREGSPGIIDRNVPRIPGIDDDARQQPGDSEGSGCRTPGAGRVAWCGSVVAAAGSLCQASRCCLFRFALRGRSTASDLQGRAESSKGVRVQHEGSRESSQRRPRPG